ncbi:MAG TPA: LuxR C-terminal-related transcriptional regulator, partial [Roseiflexaceae bacterium]|nr:LuxR C-terminal-related transcriptional regulator [Roseiflexaceae bacterium]
GIHAGARGYVLKEQDGDDIIQAIRTLHRGGTALHPTAQVQLVDSVQGRSPRLLPRELDILTKLSHGATTAEVGANLAMSESAVSRVIATIEEKLEASSRAHAVAIAMRRGLIQ